MTTSSTDASSQAKDSAREVPATSATTSDVPAFGWSGYAERVNGRFAMVGFAAVLLVLLVVPQITFQDIWLLRDPVEFDVKYQASAQPFLVLGMLVTALAVGHSPLTQVM